MKSISKQQYDEMVKQASPGSPVLKNCVLAFLFGGFLCLLGQISSQFFEHGIPALSTQVGTERIRQFIGKSLGASRCRWDKFEQGVSIACHDQFNQL